MNEKQEVGTYQRAEEKRSKGYGKENFWSK